jgi:hypothetical protein
MSRYGERRRYWPRSRAAGCLLWIVVLVALLIVLSVLFGGFQKGTKESGLGPVRGTAAVALPMGALPVGALPVGALPMGALPVGALPMGGLAEGAGPAGMG